VPHVVAQSFLRTTFNARSKREVRGLITHAPFCCDCRAPSLREARADARLAAHALHRANQRYTTQPMCHLQVRQTGLRRPSFGLACLFSDRSALGSSKSHSAEAGRHGETLGALRETSRPSDLRSASVLTPDTHVTVGRRW
jgi:hypothetical protein